MCEKQKQFSSIFLIIYFSTRYFMNDVADGDLDIINMYITNGYI